MGTRTVRRRVARVCVEGLVIVSLVLGGATPAFAAKPGGHGGGGGTSTPTGNDVSYPQCGSSLPASPAFGIVGVNDGLANNLNPCLGPSTSYPSYAQSELYWAVASSTGKSSEPKASLYVNTADPGNEYNGTLIADWPTSSLSADPFGECSGGNTDACAWQYGYNKATQDATWLTSAADAVDRQENAVSVAATAGSYPWWLDVETANTWQSDTSMNVADLQGMVAGLEAAGAATVGVYSTSYQWDTITGGTSSTSGSLYKIPDWIPGARNLSGAESNCSLASFTEGTVAITQWSARPDGDYAC